uniref:C-type lectin domain-containing protein n=1 Tax=Strigamia maritima TaxID=126957 RepID=T1IMS4_STRMM
FWIGLKNDLPEAIDYFAVSHRKPENWFWISNNHAVPLTGFTNWCAGHELNHTGPTIGWDLCIAQVNWGECWMAFDCDLYRDTGHGFACEYRDPPKQILSFPETIDKLEFGDHKYTFYNKLDVSWNEASDRCGHNLHELVSIESEAEFKFITDEVEKRKTGYWIGLSGRIKNVDTKEVSWTWLTNFDTSDVNKINYFYNWCSPDKSKQSEQALCSFITGDELCWQPWDCDVEDGLANGFICESENIQDNLV